MMIVDTTVWVDFFRGRAGPHVDMLESALSEGQDICICGVILTETLQGIRRDEDYARTARLLDDLLFLPMTRETFVRAADVYRALRRKGITVRKPVDCMIASVAIEHGVPLLHHDRDFDPIEEHFGLQVVRPPRRTAKPATRRPRKRR